MKVFDLAFLATIATVIGQYYTEQCRNTDIKSIIGGRDYEVDDIRSIHFVYAGRNQLLVFGRLTQASDGVSMAYMFLHDYLFCQSTEITYYQYINEGFKEAYVEKEYIYLLGYHKEPAGGRQEVVTTRYLKSSLYGNKYVRMEYQNFFGTPYLLTDFKGYAINYGFMSTMFGDESQLIVVDPKEIRLYSFLNLRAQQFTGLDSLSFLASAKPFYSDEVYDTQGQSEKSQFANYIAFLSADNTNLRLQLLDTLTVKIKATSQLQTDDLLKSDVRMTVYHNSVFDAAVAIIALNQGSLRILRWRVGFGVFPNEILTLSMNKQFKVMFMHYREVVWYERSLRMIAVDSENMVRFIEINMDPQEPFIVRNQASRPLDYVSFDRVLPRGASSPNIWDYWLFGVTDTMSLYDKPLVFSKRVGFIMSTEKNRISSLWELSLDDLSLTFTISTQNLIQIESMQRSQKISSTQSTNYTEIIVTNPLYSDITLDATYHDYEYFSWKNDWILEQGYNCRKDLGIPEVNSVCYYYDLYDTDAALYLDLQTLSKQIPRERSSCDQTAVLQCDRYLNLPEDEKAIRNICYPNYYEYLSSQFPPETDSGEPMIKVDKESYQVIWNQVGAPELANKYWIVYMCENSDSDFNSCTGLEIKGKYIFKRISHFNVDFDVLQPAAFSFFSEEQASDFLVSVICWSPQCPSYIKQNSYSLYTEVVDEQVIDNTYVYYIEASQLSQRNSTTYTVSFSVTKPISANINTVAININADFWEWYAANKNFIPFYAPPTTNDDIKDQSLLDPETKQVGKESKSQRQKREGSFEIVKTDLQAKLDPAVFESVSEWSDSEIILALQEARDRRERKAIVNFPKATLDQRGLLKVSFQTDIGMPSYIKKEIGSLWASETYNKTIRTQRRNRRLGLFSKSTDRVQEKEPLDSLAGTKVSKNNDEILNSSWVDVSADLAGGTNYTQNSTDASSEYYIEDWYEYEPADDYIYECDVDVDPTCGNYTGYEWYCEQEIDPTCGNYSYNISDCDIDADPSCGNYTQNSSFYYCDFDTDPSCGNYSDYNDDCELDTDPSCGNYSDSNQDCDIDTDPSCGNYPDLNQNSDSETSGEDSQSSSEECNIDEDPSCAAQQCDYNVDPDCVDQTKISRCDPSDPQCKLKKENQSNQAQPDSASVYYCNPNDPKSACYRPPVVTKKICLETQYLDEQTDTCVYLQIFFGSFEELFDVSFIKAETDQSTPAPRKLSSQQKMKLVSASDRELVVRIEFSNPIQVSPKDQLQIFTNFGVFNPGITMSEWKIPCTGQVVNSTSTQAVNSLSTASKAAIITASAGSAILQTLMKASLSQVWGMINGIQFIIHIPCINLDFPANSFLVLKHLIAIATFELPYVNLKDALKGNWKVEQVEVLTDMPPNVISSMDQLGYNDPNISNTMGTVYIITLATFIGLIAILITLPLKRLNCCKRLNKWLSKKLLWNFVIRLVLEGSLETSFAVALTLKYSRFSKQAFGSAVDYIMAVILTAAIFSLPFFLAIFYSRNYDNWNSEKFQDRFGAPLEGLKVNQKSSLFYPVYFIIRRLMFCLTSLFLHGEVIFQLLAVQVMTMISITYLVNFQPQIELLEYRLELMNEFFFVFICDLCLLFTGLDPDRHRQYNWGYVLIAAIIVCVGVHVCFLLRSIIKDMIKTVKKLRKKGWLKTFKTLQKVKHIFEVLATLNRNKLDGHKLRKKEESSEQSDEVEQSEPKRMAVIEESVNEDEESQKPVLLQPPIERMQDRAHDLSVSSLDESDDNKRGIPNKPTLLVIEDEQLVQVEKQMKHQEQNRSVLSERSASLATKILHSKGPKALNSLQEFVDANITREERVDEAALAQIVDRVQPTNSKNNLRSCIAVSDILINSDTIDYEIEQRIKNETIIQRLLNLQDGGAGLMQIEDIQGSDSNSSRNE